jgi:hypothetical protein
MEWAKNVARMVQMKSVKSTTVGESEVERPVRDISIAVRKISIKKKKKFSGFKSNESRLETMADF